MPTILEIFGWRLFFYSNERGEPIHVHAVKGEKECKYWLFVSEFEIGEAFAYRISPRDRRDIRKIIFSHFDYIVDQWEALQRGRTR